MFTGIIHHTGIIEAIDRHDQGARLTVRFEQNAEPPERGESIAVSGVCLTALPLDQSDRFAADLSPETLQRTNLGDLEQGRRVNLERALAFGDRLGGHLVQGHVDGVGSLRSIHPEGEFAVYRWEYPRSYADLVVDKGSIAVDGISLTIVEPDAESFGVALIPETLDRTTLGAASIGDRFNLEFDIMAKYARHLFGRYVGAPEDDTVPFAKS